MTDKPKIVDIGSKHKQELDDGLRELRRVMPILAETCSIMRVELENENFTSKQICRILGSYLADKV